MRRDVLMLQGPIGPFFKRFAGGLEARGFRVWKVNLNGGDRLFYRGERTIDYGGRLEHWEQHLERLVVNREIGRIYLFGDCRAYHRIAREVAQRHGIRLFVFEEGYVRPNFITLEEHGVNGNSSMMDRPVRLDGTDGEPAFEHAQPGHVFLVTAAYSMAYYWAAALWKNRFPHYRHHRPFEWLPEGLRWLRSGLRKRRYARRERRVLAQLLPEFEGNYFVCPLQVHCDMQVVVHSGFNSIEHFVGEVLSSFAMHAAPNKALVFKHHPLDRGYTDYTSLFANLLAEFGLTDRVFYVHDLDLPTLLRHAEGTVLINSTVGIQALYHGSPVRTLGRAIYDLPGLTSQQPLDAFWNQAEPVCQRTFMTFRTNLVRRNQLNGNLYRRTKGGDGAGLVWSRQMLLEHTFDASHPDVSPIPRLSVVKGGVEGNEWRNDGGAKAA